AIYYLHGLSVDYGDGRGVHKLDIPLRAGPTGFEPRVGAQSSGLTPDSHRIDPAPFFQDSVQATDTTWATLLAANSIHAGAQSLWQSSGTLSTGSANHVSLYDQDQLTSDLPDPYFPLPWGSDKGLSDAELVPDPAAPFDPDIGLWAEYTPGPAN